MHITIHMLNAEQCKIVQQAWSLQLTNSSNFYVIWLCGSLTINVHRTFRLFKILPTSTPIPIPNNTYPHEKPGKNRNVRPVFANLKTPRNNVRSDINCEWSLMVYCCKSPPKNLKDESFWDVKKLFTCDQRYGKKQLKGVTHKYFSSARRGNEYCWGTALFYSSTIAFQSN